jgi:hypothetical protein
MKMRQRATGLSNGKASLFLEHDPFGKPAPTLR